MAQTNERPPWEGGDGAPTPGSKRPTTRYQQRAMEEQTRENRQFDGNPYAPGQGGYSQAPAYSQNYSYAPVQTRSNQGTPWHGIIALIVSLMCWPAGLYISSKARQSNNMYNFYLGTIGYVLSAIGALAWAVQIFMIMKANNSR